MRLFPLVFLLALAACSTDEHAAGTTNPGVTTPAEAPADIMETPGDPVPADSATSVPE